MSRHLGILGPQDHPAANGEDASDVTYIVFTGPGAVVSPIEDPAAAARPERAADLVAASG